MATKLNLTNDEIMNMGWLDLNVRMYDFPYWDSKKKNIIRGQKAIDILDKFIT